MIVARLSKTWLILMLVGFVSLQSVAIWHAEGSLADLTQPHKRKADDSNFVTKDNRLDLETLRANHYKVRKFESSPESSGEKIPASSADNEEEVVARRGILNDLMTYAKTAIAPLQTYTDLALRFKRWHDSYKELQVAFGTDKKSGAPILADPMKVLQEEYAKVDKILAEEQCHKGEEAKKFENVDFIMKILNLLIERLETKLDEIDLDEPEQPVETGEDDPLVSERLEEIEHDAAEAFNRAKRIAARTAMNFVSNELFVIVKLMALELAMGHMINNLGVGGKLSMFGQLEPLIKWMGSANTPLLVMYFRNVQFRSLFTLINHSFSSLKCLVPARKKPRLS